MRTVSTRLTLLFVLLTAAIVGVFFASLYFWVHTRLEQSVTRDLAAQSELLRERFTEDYDEQLKAIPQKLAHELNVALSAAGAQAEIRRLDGARVFASEGFAPERPGYRSRVDQVVAGGETFSVRVDANQAPYLSQLRELRLYFAVFFPGVLGAAWLGGFLFVRRALSPVDEIRRHAERISRANLTERVPEPALQGEFRDLARTFNGMLDRLQGAVEDLENFAADAAHELRTPLANLRAEIETAVARGHSPEECDSIVGSFAEEVSRMSRIVTDLLTLARVDLRQYAFQKERLHLEPLLRDARETWQASATEQGIRIDMEGPDAEVEGDPVALRRVFMNLVENAVKYNREGGRVLLRIERESGAARVRVADTGIGIPSEHLPLLFRRFYRIDKARSRQTGGAGLGLAICKSFIEAHQGSIRVTSDLDKGTEFTVELPATPAVSS